MIHETKIKNYKGTLSELATDIGNLRYDTLSEFLELLAKKIQADGNNDLERGRTKLAKQLHDCSANLKLSQKTIDEAWRICEPFME